MLTSAELEVLAGCSGTAVKAYLRLRARMDLATGIVGQRSGMSYQALREWTEETIEKGAGALVVQPSLRNIRTAVEQLQRRGLLRRLKTEGLSFLCLLARRAEVRTNQTRHEPGRGLTADLVTEPGTEGDTNPAVLKPIFDAGLSGVVGDAPGTEPGTERDTNLAGGDTPNPADIRYQSKPSTSQAASTYSTGAGASGAYSAAEGLSRLWGRDGEEVGKGDRKVIELVAWLRRNGAAVQAANPKVRAWVTEGIDEGLIARALDIAKDDRGPSPQPVNAGLLDAIVRRLLVERDKPPRRRNWAAASDVQLEERARELGVHSVGRSRAEVVAAIVAREHAEAAA